MQLDVVVILKVRIIIYMYMYNNLRYMYIVADVGLDTQLRSCKRTLALSWCTTT